jgi:CubicO group peptidase (beta-lactamase class C family)
MTPLVALLLSFAGQVAVPHTPPLTEAGVDAIVQTALSNWEVPGAAVVVVTRQRPIYIKGHGVRRLGRPEPVTADTVFPLASCTKAFTATLIAMLADDGKLGLDDPVRKHLPDFRLSDPLANDGVSLRDLLCQRTGLASHDELWYRSPWPLRDIVRRAGHLPPARPFRTAFQYQSVMYSAAGLAAGAAGGAPWEDLTRERILRPLGMAATSCTTPSAGELASPHRPDAVGTLQPVSWYEQKEPNPAGSVHTTARDLSAWLMFQLGDGTWNGRRLVSEANLNATHTPHVVQLLDGTSAATHADTVLMSYGLGWVVQDYRGTLLWSHTGMIDGFRAQVALAPRAGYGVAVLSNRHQSRMNLALINTLLDRLLGLPPRNWDGHLKGVVAREEEASAAARAEYERQRRPPPRSPEWYVGRYEHPAYGPMTVTPVGGTLLWQWGAFRAPLRHHHGDAFDIAELALDEPAATFAVAADRAVSLTIFGVTLPRVAP